MIGLRESRAGGEKDLLCGSQQAWHCCVHVEMLPMGSTSLLLLLTMEICHLLRSSSRLGFSDIRVPLDLIGFSPGNKPSTGCRRAAPVCSDRTAAARRASPDGHGGALTDAEVQRELVGSLQLPAEGELQLEGLPAPHHQVADVVTIRVVQAAVLALEEVEPSDLQVAPWKTFSRKGERKGKRLMVNCSAKAVFFLMEPHESPKHLSVK